MKNIQISDEAYEWFQRRRFVKRKKKTVGQMSENEFMILLLNWWELLPTKPKIWRSLNGSVYEFIVREKT